VQVVAIALKDVVLLDANLDVQVARWATVGAGLAVAGCCGCACRRRCRLGF
jgi:tartrate dehydratase alpha subunit/fumarate hydratase class I-like protein